MPAHKIPLETRLMNHSVPEPMTGCWLWTGSGQARGKIKINKKYVLAPRASYAHFKGPIEGGKLVCHTCDNPWCINPDHLYLGTNSDNQKDRYRRTKRFNRDETTGRFV